MRIAALFVLTILATFSSANAAENYNGNVRFWDDLDYERGNMNRVWINSNHGCKPNVNPAGNQIVQSKSSTLSAESYDMDLSQTIDAIMNTPYFPSFGNLYLRNSKLGGKSLRRLNEVISSRETALNGITDLYLGKNSFSREDINMIANFLLRNMSGSLEILDLEDVGLNDDSSSIISASLMDLKNLRALYLGKNSLGDEGFGDLMNGIQTLSNLQILSVQSAGITDASIRRLVEILPKMRNLQILDLKGNNISKEGFVSIFKIALMMPNLIVVDVNSAISLDSSKRIVSQITSCSAYSSDMFLSR